MSNDPKAFGPSAILTPANGLTLIRLVAGIALAVVIAEVGHASWPVFSAWCVIAVSDGADGKLARWHGTTRSGAFLDPLADKFLVLGALSALAYTNHVSAIAVALIGVREIAMSAFRAASGRQGVSIPARLSAKAKTIVQDFAIGFALAPLIENGHGVIATVLLWCAVALTISTGIEYWRDACHSTLPEALERTPISDHQAV